MRKRENKNYSFVPSLPDAKFKIPKKISKKFEKLKNTILASFKAKKQIEHKQKFHKGRERKKINIFVPFRSYPTRNRKFQSKAKKFKKIKKIPLWLHFEPKYVELG